MQKWGGRGGNGKVMMTWNAIIWPDMRGSILTDADRWPGSADLAPEPDLESVRFAV
jgi:hypothetical protein